MLDRAIYKNIFFFPNIKSLLNADISIREVDNPWIVNPLTNY